MVARRCATVVFLLSWQLFDYNSIIAFHACDSPINVLLSAHDNWDYIIILESASSAKLHDCCTSPGWLLFRK